METHAMKLTAHSFCTQVNVGEGLVQLLSQQRVGDFLHTMYLRTLLTLTLTLWSAASWLSYCGY